MSCRFSCSQLRWTHSMAAGLCALLAVCLYVGGALCLPSAVSSANQPHTQRLRDRGVVCFCNMPGCISSNYLCRSEGLGCFSDLIDNQDINQAIHGCLDLLPKDKERNCQNVPASGGREGSLLLCCHQDMCNHVDSPEAREKYNETISAVRNHLRLGEEGERVEYTDQDALWFRAATVAVPIFGALILLILIFLALKILRTDPQSLQPKLRVGSSRGPIMIGTNNPHIDTGVKKLPLLYQHNDCGSRGQEKNEANAKLNSPSTLLDLHKTSQRAPCNLYQPLIPSPQQMDPSVYNNSFLIDWGANP